MKDFFQKIDVYLTNLFIENCETHFIWSRWFDLMASHHLVKITLYCAVNDCHLESVMCLTFHDKNGPFHQWRHHWKKVDVFRNFRHTNLVYKWQNIWYYQTFSHLYTPYKKSSFISKPYQFQMYLFCISDIKGWRTLCTVCKWWHLCSIYAFASHPSYEGRQDMSVCTKRNP